MMGTFEEGQWVRVIDNEGAKRFYNIGEVCQVESVDGTVRCVGKTAGMYSYRFEAWTPKVGDRVVVTYGFEWDGEGIVELVTEFGTANVKMLTGKFAGELGGFALRNITPPPAPALTISAGKFYKTRDGRKVGPMITWPDINDNHFTDRLCEVHGDGRYWKLDGKGFGADDLIAEWVDEPATKASNDNAAPAKFKVGDRVRVATRRFGDRQHGKTGVIRNTNYPSKNLSIEIAYDQPLDHGLSYNQYRIEDLELVTAPATTPAIVALIENGVAKPAFEPKVHASEAEATVEAERLAGVYRGQRFGIFVLSDTREADIPTYDHEWQNLAARGEKIGAIKELRSITGMGLKPAKDAVEYFLAAA